MNRAAIVTGGAGAIGSAVARRLCARGYTVATLDRSDSSQLQAEIAAAGGQGFGLPVDLGRADSIRAAFGTAVSRLGGLDVLVNAGGVVSLGRFHSLAEEEWDRVLDINLKGVFLSCQVALEPLQASRGRIINIGSVLAKNGGNARPWIDPTEADRASNVAYAASKAGVHALTLYLARELAIHGITVNAVAPGPIASSMTSVFPDALRRLIPIGRLGTPDEVAGAVEFLAGDDSRYVTGEILDVNGGLWTD